MHVSRALWGGSAVTWAATVTTIVTDAQLRLWASSLGVSMVTSLAALQASMVTARLDRAYTAMARAFIQRHEREVPPPRGRHQLTVVRGRDTGAP